MSVGADLRPLTAELAASLARPAWLLPSSLPPGLHQGVPENVYHSREKGIASKSALDLVAQSPAHYEAWLRGEDRAETPAMAFGKAFHMAVLEPERYKAFRDVFVGGAARKREDAALIDGMLAALLAHPLAHRLLTQSRTELTLRWEAGGVQCKGRLDGLLDEIDLPWDLKSTIDASPAEFVRSVANFGYHRQAAMYVDGLAAIGRPASGFLFVACEKAPPHGVGVYSLSPRAIEKGRASIARDLETLASCCASGVFPGYGDKIIELDLPPWA